MTFPKLPDGYRWDVFPLIPTRETVGERQVRLSIVQAHWFRRSIAAFVDAFGVGNPYETWIKDANDETVIAAAEKLYANFMFRQSLPDDAKRWESYLNRNQK